ncbi:MAG: hypothetical protein Kow0042_25160 [Calditrichia bacterium]
MNLKTAHQPYRQLPEILSVFLQTLTIGSYSFLFLITFLTFETDPFEARFELFKRSLPYIGFGGILVLVILYLIQKQETWRQKGSSSIIHFLRENEVDGFGLFALLLTGSMGLRLVHIDLTILYFITFLAAVFALLQMTRFYTFYSGRPSWNHPSTAGSLIQGTILLGASSGLWVLSDPSLNRLLIWICAAFLLIEGLTIWNRFRFLSRANVITRQSAMMMLGSHLTLFGVRFIFGLAMPLVYFAWYLFVRELPLHPALLMIVVGELSERILFFITALPYSPPEHFPEGQSHQNGETHHEV